MSWDQYLDSIIAYAPADCDKAAIIGKDGSIWTTAANGKGMNVMAAEAATLGKACASNEFSGLQASGIYLEGEKYQFLRAQETLILGKKKDKGAVSCQSSNTAVVIGHTKEGGSQGNTNKGVSAIAEYLHSLGM